MLLPAIDLVLCTYAVIAFVSICLLLAMLILLTKAKFSSKTIRTIDDPTKTNFLFKAFDMAVLKKLDAPGESLYYERNPTQSRKGAKF